MARLGDALSAPELSRAPKQRGQATRSRGIKENPTLRNSERMSQIRSNPNGQRREQGHSFSSVEEACTRISRYNPELTQPTEPQSQNLPLPSTRQKRPREEEDPASYILTGRRSKRPSTHGPSRRQTDDRETANGLSPAQHNHINHWTEQQDWPEEYFQMDITHHLLARPKSLTSLRRKRSEGSFTASLTPSDQRPRDEKSAPYRNANYSALLETLGDSYMGESTFGITDASNVLIENLLKKECAVPNDTLFRDDVFPTACGNLRDRNEARIMMDFARLLVPSPEALTALGATDISVLIESVNEGWNNCIPITSPRPQPDFSVGFRRSAFSDNQLVKIQPLLGDISSLSYFRATYYMYFPFFTCEVKCGAIGLEIADRQNSHSMSLTVRGIVELYKLAKRESELHRELQTFSISHDHRTVRLYGYYPEFDGPKTRIYRHQIHTFDITALRGKERWTTYKFTVAIYYHSLTLLKRICSVIDELPPDFHLKLSQPSESSGLS